MLRVCAHGEIGRLIRPLLVGSLLASPVFSAERPSIVPAVIIFQTEALAENVIAGAEKPLLSKSPKIAGLFRRHSPLKNNSPDSHSTLTVADMCDVLGLFFRAKRAAFYSPAAEARVYAAALGADFVRDYYDPQTLKERFAIARLFSFPPYSLLADFKTLPYGSPEYKLTVLALSVNMDLTFLPWILELSGDEELDAAKRSDVNKILRGIQYQAFLLHDKSDGNRATPNRRTWEGRGAATLALIRDQVLAYRRLHPGKPINILDGAISEGVTTLELAKALDDIPHVHITGFDIATTYQIVNGLIPGYSLVFDSFNRLIQAYPKNSRGRPWVRWTLLVYKDNTEERERELATASNILIGEQRCPAGSVKAIEMLYAGVRKRIPLPSHVLIDAVSLISPDVLEYARLHPYRLTIQQADVFDPPHAPDHSAYVVVRILGLFSRDKERYFQIETMLDGLKKIATRYMEPDGLLYVGIDGTLHHKDRFLLDIYGLNDRGELVLKSARTYDHETGTQSIHADDHPLFSAA